MLITRLGNKKNNRKIFGKKNAKKLSGTRISTPSTNKIHTGLVQISKYVFKNILS